MRVFPLNIKHLLVVAALVSSNLSGFLDGGESVQAQTGRQLASQIEADKTPADISITSGVSLLIGTGDFNGDGADDFLVRYNRKVSDDTQPIVFFKFGIIFGKRNQSQPVTINLATDEPDLSLTTKVKPPFADSEITPLGDLNGDGVDDIGVIQEVPIGTGELRDRRLKVIFGSSNLRPGTVDLDALQPDLTIMFDTSMLAPWVAGVADVNGDGVRDLLLTTIGNSNSFAVPILFGPFTAGQTIDLSLHQPDVIILADNRVDFVTGAGVFLADVNGDRITDVLIKKSRLDPQSGFFYITTLEVVFGSQNLHPGVEISISDGQADASLRVGINLPVISTGDVNGDGIDDILIGVPAYSGEPFPPDWFSGSVSIILGSSTLGTPDLEGVSIGGLSRPFSLKPIYQTTLGDRLGESMAVGDINGDGVPDLLIGAPGITSDRKGRRITSLSRAHIILGSITPGTRIQTELNQQDITISFDSNTSGVGRQISSGDFNGDGVGDILVGSEGGGGDAYVFFGGPLRPPEITKAKYRSDASELVVFGTNLTGLARVEVNGVLVDREATFELAEGRLVVQGLKSELNLRSGKNQIAVVRKGARSNTIKLKL